MASWGHAIWSSSRSAMRSRDRRRASRTHVPELLDRWGHGLSLIHARTQLIHRIDPDGTAPAAQPVRRPGSPGRQACRSEAAKVTPLCITARYTSDSRCANPTTGWSSLGRGRQPNVTRSSSAFLISGTTRSASSRSRSPCSRGVSVVGEPPKPAPVTIRPSSICFHVRTWSENHTVHNAIDRFRMGEDAGRILERDVEARHRRKPRCRDSGSDHDDVPLRNCRRSYGPHAGVQISGPSPSPRTDSRSAHPTPARRRGASR